MAIQHVDLSRYKAGVLSSVYGREVRDDIANGMQATQDGINAAVDGINTAVANQLITVDDQLQTSGAGADAALVGNTFLRNNALNILDLYSKYNSSASGITFSWAQNGACTISGVSTTIRNLDIVGSNYTFPIGIEAGKEYAIKYQSENVLLEFAGRVGTSNEIFLSTKTDAVLTIPSEAQGCRIYFTIPANTSVDETVTPRVLSSPPNEDIFELRSAVDTLNDGGLVLKDEIIAEDVQAWLAAHPEATTTVQNGSVTAQKLAGNAVTTAKIADRSVTEDKVSSDLLPAIKNQFVTPEQYGAVGDGITDDSSAIQAAIDSGQAVWFKKTTYKVDNTITVGAGAYMNGNWCLLTGAANPLISIQTYETSQIHSSIPVVFSGFRIAGDDTNTLISVKNALKATISYVELRKFSIGVQFDGGYENLFENLRFFGQSGSTAVKIVSGGDSTFTHLYGTDCPIAIWNSSGHNTFYDIHFWILDSDLYPGSIMILDEVPGGPTVIYNEIYFDTYQHCYHKTGLGGAIFNNPRYFSNADIADSDDSILFFIDNPSFSDYPNRVRFNNLITSIANTTRCVFACNDTTIPLYITFLPTNSEQRNRLILCNLVADLDERQLAQAECIDMNTGYTIVGGQAWKKNRRVFGDYVVQCSAALAEGSQTTIGKFLLSPFAPVNTFCVTATTQWASTDIAYLYYSPSSIAVKPTVSDQTFIKLHFDYIVAT